MVNKIISDRLGRLREMLAKHSIDYYMMPTADFHQSEYVNDYFKVREYFSNFTGSNGTLLVWKDGAGLWTDGRYFIQAAGELEGTGVELMRMQEEGVPTIEEFLKRGMTQGQTLGFDGRVIAAADGKKYEENLSQNGVKISYNRDLAEEIWTDRPSFPAGPVTVLDEAVAGKSVEEKLSEVRAKLSEEGAEAFLLSKLDDIMWLFNIRGCDVECNPVAMSYGYVTMAEAWIFLQDSALKDSVREYLSGHGIQVMEYSRINSFVEEMARGKKVLADVRYLSYTLYKILQEAGCPVEKRNPTELLKAVKNPAELENMERVYLQDSVAVTKFIYWVKTHVGKERITEVSASDYLEQLRRQIPGFLDLSFPTIAGYKANAAMMHYEADADSCAELKPEGMLLVDSGGQYIGGTTDVTRTIVLGPVTDEEKLHYTAVAAGMLELSNTIWLHGCTGRNLDIRARGPVWNLGLDYKCGTGHGVGYILNVHEGPQNIRWRFTDGLTEAVIEDGMDITNEPGIYIEGSHGIRIENVMVAENVKKNEYGQFMRFKTLTYVPVDMDAIEEKYLTDTQRAYLYAYQREVYDRVSPYLNEEEREWLRKETGAESTIKLFAGQNS